MRCARRRGGAYCAIMLRPVPRVRVSSDRVNRECVCEYAGVRAFMFCVSVFRNTLSSRPEGQAVTATSTGCSIPDFGCLSRLAALCIVLYIAASDRGRGPAARLCSRSVRPARASFSVRGTSVPAFRAAPRQTARDSNYKYTLYSPTNYCILHIKIRHRESTESE